MSTNRREEKYEQAYQKAIDIIDKEWLEAGKTQEELDQERQIAELLDRLVAQGCSLDTHSTCYPSGVYLPDSDEIERRNSSFPSRFVSFSLRE